MEHNKEKNGWSWLGFLFMPYYYAGYGALKKGIIFAIIAGLIAGIEPSISPVMWGIALVIGLGIAIYGGLKARKELPIKEEIFSWRNVMITVGVYIITMLITTMIFLSMKPNTPKCNDIEAKRLVKKIAQNEFTKMGTSGVKITLANIRIADYDEGIDKYECAAELTAFHEIGDEIYSTSIIYTSQMTEDNENFYVEVFGL